MLWDEHDQQSDTQPNQCTFDDDPYRLPADLPNFFQVFDLFRLSCHEACTTRCFDHSGFIEGLEDG